MCNLHCYFILNLSYSSIVRTAPQLGIWSNYFDLHNSILESRAIEFRDWCQWRMFPCFPAACLLFVYDVCGIEVHTNQAEAVPTNEKLNSQWANNCVKFWKPTINYNPQGTTLFQIYHFSRTSDCWFPAHVWLRVKWACRNISDSWTIWGR